MLNDLIHSPFSNTNCTDASGKYASSEDHHRDDNIGWSMQL